MSKREQGFTLIELMIVVAIIAIIASIAIPNLLSARLNANESAAIATLRNISSSQAQCQASAIIDANRNGAGEYGYFAELAGGTATRSDEAGAVAGEIITPAFLSGAFSNVQNSRVLRSGYWFQMYLPNSSVAPTAEAAGGGGSGVSISAGFAEVLWCCYAWPTSYGNSGKRLFFVNQSGDVLSARNNTTRYSGTATATVPAGTAAFHTSVSSATMASTVAANATGKDGNVYVVVQ